MAMHFQLLHLMAIIEAMRLLMGKAGGVKNSCTEWICPCKLCELQECEGGEPSTP